mmetsp:Transcript_99707/g.145753  ORF Transcript_99707/g.145753 Transcript_99707/m.145753 type:complete len:342 (+) Transcript_99707:1-1026(+)
MMQTDVCALYLAHGALVDATDEEGMTALHHACDTGNVALVRRLLTHGANVTVTTTDGKTALGLARIRWQGSNQLKTISELLLPAMECAGASSELIGCGTSEVAKGSSSKAKRARAEEAALAFAEAMRLDPTLAAELDHVRHSDGTTEDEKDDLILETVKKFKAADAVVEKQRGNKALKEGDVAASYAHYSEAIRLAPDKHELYTNRAAAALRLNKPQEALEDAQTAKRMAPQWPKAAFREGQAYRALGLLPDAAASFWEAHRMDPSSADAKDSFNKCVFEAKQAQALQKGELTTNAEKREADLKDWSRSAATATAAATAAATPHPGTPSTSHQSDTAQQSE